MREAEEEARRQAPIVVEKDGQLLRQSVSLRESERERERERDQAVWMSCVRGGNWAQMFWLQRNGLCTIQRLAQPFDRSRSLSLSLARSPLAHSLIRLY